MATLRSTTTSAPPSAGPNTIAHPAGLDADDVVTIFVVTDVGSALTFTATGFTQVWAGNIGDTAAGVLVGTGLSGAGTITVSASDSGAWLHLAAAAWSDADTTLDVGTEEINTGTVVVPAVTTTTDDADVLVFIAQAYSSIASISDGSELVQIGGGGHGWIYTRGNQVTAGPSGSVTFETAAPWFDSIGVQIAVPAATTAPVPSGGFEILDDTTVAPSGERSSTASATVAAEDTTTPVGRRTSTAAATLDDSTTVTPLGARTATGTAVIGDTTDITPAGQRSSTGHATLDTTETTTPTGQRASTAAAALADVATVTTVGDAPGIDTPTGHFTIADDTTIDPAGHRASTGTVLVTGVDETTVAGARRSVTHLEAADLVLLVVAGGGLPLAPPPERTTTVSAAHRRSAVAAQPRTATAPAPLRVSTPAAHDRSLTLAAQPRHSEA